jgi:hypothetical protein
LLSEAKDKLKHSPVTVSPVGSVNLTEVTQFDALAAELDADSECGAIFSIQAPGCTP